MAGPSFKPPQSVANAAARGLRLRKKAGGRGGLTNRQASAQGIGSGVQRARDLSNRRNISLSTIKRMKAFFDRHEKNRTIDPKFKNMPWKDRGFVAWLLWGGDPGRAWSNRILKQVERSQRAAKILLDIKNQKL